VNLNYSNFTVANINSGTVLNTGGANGTCNGTTINTNCSFTITYTGSPTVTPLNSDVLIEGASGGGITLNDPGTTSTNNPFGGFAAAPNPWLVTAKNGVEASAVDYTLNVDPSSGISLNQLSLTATVFSHSSASGGSQAVTFLEVCPGVATFSEGCTGEMLLMNGIITGHNFSQTATLSTSIFTPTNVFGIQQVILLTTGGSTGSDAGLTNILFGTPGVVTPEPGTVGTIGTGILAVGLLYARRLHRFRKKS
jgi:hypothetical protein